MTSHPNRSRDWPAIVRAFRAKHGLTQAALADSLKISKRTVEDWESGARTPMPYLLPALKWMATKR